MPAAGSARSARSGAAHVAIVGAGFSGTLLSVHLLRRAGGLRRVTLIDRSGTFGPGLAYGTRIDSHLLNVVAGRMGAFPDRETDFVDWLHANGRRAAPGDFLPRSWFGDYLADTLDRAERDASGRVSLARIPKGAVGATVSAAGVRLLLSDGSAVQADRLVLALGNEPPAAVVTVAPELLVSGAYAPNPWDARWLGSPPPAGPVIVIGTGLTMLDAVLELRARGFAGHITAVSRRGLLPKRHRPPKGPPLPSRPWDELQAWDGRLASLARIVKRRAARAEAGGGDWRDVINSMRSFTHVLWQRLTPVDRARFMARLRPYWDSHRHRGAEEVMNRIEAERDAGRLRVLAARPLRIIQRPPGVGVELVERETGRTVWLEGSAAVNCTGPAFDPRVAGDPLLDDLIGAGVAQVDPLSIGLETDPRGALIDRAGRVSERVFTLGQLLRPRLWETTAVPELRVQAAELAGVLASE